MDISVVVPVYNTSRFLRQCVDSLINQTWKDVEFILVDDGSTDDSLEILKEYQKRDARIKVLEQKNLHAGVARNNGMKQATGKYIIFLDSDDYFDLTLLERAFRCAEKNRAEIVFFGCYWFDDQTGAMEKKPFQTREGVFSGEMLGEKVFSTFNVAPWNKLFLRSFVEKHHLEFQTLHRFNDVYFGLLSMALAERIVCVDEPLVYYRFNNPESLQGKRVAAYPYYIECYSALKQSLTARGKFHGQMRSAYNKTASANIERKAEAKPEIKLSKQFYTEMKKNLIPNLFDAAEDIPDFAVNLKAIAQSADYEHYILLQFETLKNEMVSSKKSKDYIIGHALLAVPRIIRNAVWPEGR